MTNAPLVRRSMSLAALVPACFLLAAGTAVACPIQPDNPRLSYCADQGRWVVTPHPYSPEELAAFPLTTRFDDNAAKLAKLGDRRDRYSHDQENIQQAIDRALPGETIVLAGDPAGTTGGVFHFGGATIADYDAGGLLRNGLRVRGPWGEFEYFATRESWSYDRALTTAWAGQRPLGWDRHIVVWKPLTIAGPTGPGDEADRLPDGRIAPKPLTRVVGLGNTPEIRYRGYNGFAGPLMLTAPGVGLVDLQWERLSAWFLALFPAARVENNRTIDMGAAPAFLVDSRLGGGAAFAGNIMINGVDWPAMYAANGLMANNRFHHASLNGVLAGSFMPQFCGDSCMPAEVPAAAGLVIEGNVFEGLNRGTLLALQGRHPQGRIDSPTVANNRFLGGQNGVLVAGQFGGYSNVAIEHNAFEGARDTAIFMIGGIRGAAVTDNDIRGSRYGIRAAASLGTFEGLAITGNAVRNSLFGIELNGAYAGLDASLESPVVRGNLLENIAREGIHLWSGQWNRWSVNGASITANEFVATGGGGVAAVRIEAGVQDSMIQANDYRRSGLTGMHGMPPADKPAIRFWRDADEYPPELPLLTRGNRVTERLFPPGTSLCTMIVDDTMTPENPRGMNLIPGLGPRCRS